MPITPAEDRNAWYLETPNTLYVIALSSLGIPVQRYWGAGLPLQDRENLLRGTHPRLRVDMGRADEVEDEVLHDGGLRWGVSGLQVDLDGESQSLELDFVDATTRVDAAGQETLVLALRDRLLPLTVRLCYRLRDTTDVIERWLELEWGTAARSPLNVVRADSANWFMDDADDYWQTSTFGHWAAESQLARGPVPVGELTFTSRTGTTGHHANPWVMIHEPSATETSGVVRTVALGWSGSWRLTTQRRPEGGLSVTTGFGHDRVRLTLEPGEVHVTPPSYGLVSAGGFGQASRTWHAFAVEHLRPSGAQIRPVLYNSWEATEFDVEESAQIRLAERAARIGAELFVVDDGWFGSRTSSKSGLGDWHPNPQRFPDGLHRLVQHVRGLGMGFGLWVEPEMVNRDSDLYQSHPEWVLHLEGRERLEVRNQLVLNYARADVQAWALAWLDDLVGTYELDFLKWDMNRPFSQAGWPERGRKQGALWLEHTRAVYRILATLRDRHPTLRVEICSGGGGRVDLGMMEFADQFWTSDNTDALDRQTIQHGFSQIYPAAAMTNWVTDSPNPFTGRRVPLDYRFHVAMAGVLGIGGDLSVWTDEELDAASAHVATYKGIRDVVQLGALSRLGGTPGSDLSAVQYSLGGRVVVLSFEPRRSLHHGRRRLLLQDLDAGRDYRLEASGEIFSGRFLMEHGIPIHDRHHLHATTRSLRFSNSDYLSELTVLALI